jgi:hypothetical protein
LRCGGDIKSSKIRLFFHFGVAEAAGQEASRHFPYQAKNSCTATTLDVAMMLSTFGPRSAAICLYPREQ